MWTTITKNSNMFGVNSPFSCTIINCEISHLWWSRSCAQCFLFQHCFPLNHQWAATRLSFLHLIVLQYRAPNTIKTRTWQSLHNKEQTKILPSQMELFPLLSGAIKSHFPSQVLSLLQITAVHITNKLCRYYFCLSGSPEESRGEIFIFYIFLFSYFFYHRFEHRY